MKKSKVIMILFFVAAITITACKDNASPQPDDLSEEMSSIRLIEEHDQPSIYAISMLGGYTAWNMDWSMWISENKEESTTEQISSDNQPTIEDVDWSVYFEGLKGGAVIYIPDDNKYIIYNKEISNIRTSPCSTFKIVSSLIGIEYGIISAENSVRKWSGEAFWNDKWNRDIDFKQAFQASCIWYFREVINDLGQAVIQNELNRLNYGNCDSSDWEGYLNNNNSNRALTGFWVESSLKISPKEQVEVLECIFGNHSVYDENTIKLLKDAMLVTDSELSDRKVYGKTGLGKSNGIVVDAWFTGYTEVENKNAYFCVYLGETENKEVSSLVAKKIAFQLIKNEINVQ